MEFNLKVMTLNQGLKTSIILILRYNKWPKSLSRSETKDSRSKHNNNKTVQYQVTL